jgi:MFS family permease
LARTILTGRGRFLGVASFQVLAMFRRGLFYNYLAIYLRHFLGLSVTETTLFATLPMALNIFFQTFIWGRISDRYQVRRTLIILGELLAGAGTLVIWYAHTFAATPRLAGYVIICGLALVEAFWSMSNIGWSALISDLYGEGERSRIQGQLASFGGAGRILGVWSGGLLYDGLGLQYAGWGFHQGALFGVAAAVMLISVIPMWFMPEGGIQAETQTAKPGSQVNEESKHAAGVFLFFLIAMIFINFGRNAIAVIQTQYLVLESGLGVSSQVLSYIVNTQSVAMILAGLSAGRLEKRLGNGNLLMGATLMAVIALVILAFSMNLPLIYLSNFIRGLSEVLILATSYTYASKLIPAHRRGRQFAVFNATFFLSWGLAGTFIAGPVADLLMARGSTEVFAYQMSFLSAAMIALVGLLLLGILITRERARRPVIQASN